MPELPELEALSERMTEVLEGHALGGIDVHGFSALKTFEINPKDLEGIVLGGISRRGKYLDMSLSPYRILFHLSQGGRVDIETPPKSTKPRGSVVRFRFDGAPSILIKEFGTERKAAWWVLRAGDDGPLEKLGPEPFDEAYEELVMTGADRRQLHTFLRDQRTVAGIGRGFADDILHAAMLSPLAKLASLDEAARRTLVEQTHKVLIEATERERERTGGLPAKMGDRFTIHNHYEDPCPRCGTKLEHVSYESREVVYCPACQTGGKILADRRMSRLLK
ncbi:MAG: hypothetical protein GEU71_10355 [Actinobacteria bacterium]|nr:hypothetical protein [Actinomycetota bacterium]